MKRILFLASLFSLCSAFSFSQKRWSFELHGGGVYNVPLPLIIKQDGYPDIKIKKAEFFSEPLNDPFYWDWRFARWKNRKSFEFEAVHHKLYLKNRPPEVEWFGISHGFNMLTVNRSREIRGMILRVGMGSVLVHPESTVRGMKYPVGPGFDIPGYRLRGVTVNMGAAKQIPFGRFFFVNAEAKVNASFARVPVVNGEAEVYNVVFQLILGPGINWCLKE